MTYEPVRFTGVQALHISKGFVRAIEQSRYVIHACTIMPDHTHLVVARHDQDTDRMIGHFKAAATMKLQEAGLHPFAGEADAKGDTPSPWVRKGWTVYLDSEQTMRRAITYVENNPLKEGLPQQQWSFVTPYDGRIVGERSVRSTTSKREQS